jgi:hypothetical protein
MEFEVSLEDIPLVEEVLGREDADIPGREVDIVPGWLLMSELLPDIPELLSDVPELPDMPDVPAEPVLDEPLPD